MVLLEISSGGETLFWITLSSLFPTEKVFWFLQLQISTAVEREDYLHWIKTCFWWQSFLHIKLSSTQATSVDKSRASSCEVKWTLHSAVSFVSQETFVWDSLNAWSLEYAQASRNVIALKIAECCHWPKVPIYIANNGPHWVLPLISAEDVSLITWSGKGTPPDSTYWGCERFVFVYYCLAK